MTYSEGKRQRFLENLRLVNERAKVDPEIIDLIEAFARIELDHDRAVNLTPPAPNQLSKKVHDFLRKNSHLPQQTQDFLATYCQRLHSQGIIFLLNSAHLAATLSLPQEQLNRLAATTDKRYFSYNIPKRDGSVRSIHAPNSELKVVQRTILDDLLSFSPLSLHAEGFRRNRSIVTNSQRHVSQKVVVKLDLKDFFPSITSQRIFGLFLGLGYPRQVASLLTGLTTYKGALPTGAPTSPVLSNLVCRRLDKRLAGVAQKMQFEYSRYADDLTFSSQNPQLVQLIPFIQEIIQEEGFEVKTPKTRIQRNGGQQKVTGIVVNCRPNIASKEIRSLRAIIHNSRNGNLQEQVQKYAELRGLANTRIYTMDSFKASLRGKINHVRQVNPKAGDRLLLDYLHINFPA